LISTVKSMQRMQFTGIQYVVDACAQDQRSLATHRLLSVSGVRTFLLLSMVRTNLFQIGNAPAINKWQ